MCIRDALRFLAPPFPLPLFFLSFFHGGVIEGGGRGRGASRRRALGLPVFVETFLGR